MWEGSWAHSRPLKLRLCPQAPLLILGLSIRKGQSFKHPHGLQVHLPLEGKGLAAE